MVDGVCRSASRTLLLRQAICACVSLGLLVGWSGISPAESLEPRARDIVKKKTVQWGLNAGFLQAQEPLGNSLVGDSESVNRSGIHLFPQVGTVITEEFEAGYFSGNLSVLAEPFFTYYYQPFDAYTVGVAGVLRYNFLSFDRWLPFAEVSFGPMYTDLAPRIEEQSSQFNFLTQVGLGAQFFMTQRQALTLGIRWHHFSSADIGDRNVGVNSLLAFLGLAFYIPD